KMIADRTRFLFINPVHKKAGQISRPLYLEPGSICKDRAHRTFQQDIVNTFFILFSLDRLADALEINDLFQLLLKYRGRGQVKRNDQKREYTVSKGKGKKRQIKAVPAELNKGCRLLADHRRLPGDGIEEIGQVEKYEDEQQ